jgi:hypothetical protein
MFKALQLEVYLNKTGKVKSVPEYTEFPLAFFAF